MYSILYIIFYNFMLVYQKNSGFGKLREKKSIVIINKSIKEDLSKIDKKTRKNKYTLDKEYRECYVVYNK